MQVRREARGSSSSSSEETYEARVDVDLDGLCVVLVGDMRRLRTLLLGVVDLLLGLIDRGRHGGRERCGWLRSRG